MVLLKFKCIIFDLDGTIYFGDKLADKANEVISRAREIAQYVFFVTNNSAKTREQIWNKLIAMGIDVRKEEVISSSYAIAKYLNENHYTEIYCVGTKSLKREIELAGISTNSKKPQAVVVGYNPDFKLNDLDELSNIELSNYKLIIANKERNYPKENGYIVPGAGPIVAAVENLLNKQIDVVIGKPESEMLDIMLLNLDIKPNEICIIGDSYESDIKMAQNYGAKGIWISKKKKDDCICIGKLPDLLEMWND